MRMALNAIHIKKRTQIGIHKSMNMARSGLPIMIISGNVRWEKDL